MQLRHLHDWNLTPREAIALQRELRGRVDHDRPIPLQTVKLVAGVDVSVKEGVSRAAIVVCALPDFAVVESVRAELPTPFPYVPGLLTFREGPVLEEAFGRLQHEPDAFLFDGLGIAHPRRIGIAAHMGLWLGRPSVGCGKSRLCGFHEEVGPVRGDRVALRDRVREAGADPRAEEVIGTVLRTRTNVAPLFISPGHLADIETSAALTLMCATRYRLPEPVRLAHRFAALGKGAVLL